jgi:hypothetical protein
MRKRFAQKANAVLLIGALIFIGGMFDGYSVPAVGTGIYHSK